MKINIKKLRENVSIPARASESAAGYDLCAWFADDGWIIILPHQTVKIYTGIAVEIPVDCFGAIFARSGIAAQKGLRPANCVGVVDSDYRGELIVALRNDTDDAQTVANGERIAQLVIVPYIAAEFVEVDELSDTPRGVGGFGSTGTTSLVTQEPVYEQLSMFSE